MIVPMLVHFAGQPAPTAEERERWYNLNLDAALWYEERSNVNRAPYVQYPAVVLSVDEAVANPWGVAWDDHAVWGQVERLTRERGYDVSQYAICALARGTAFDDGAALPWPFVGWGDHDYRGGLAVIGGGVLTNAMQVRKPVAGAPWTPTERAAYFHALWIVLHEWGHLGGVTHPDGGADPALARHTLMSYASRNYFTSTEGMLTLGFTDDEAAVLAGNAAWDHVRIEQGIMRVHVPDRALMLAGQLPLHQGLGHGRSVMEYQV